MNMIRIALGAALAMTLTTATAQSWPQKPIRLVLGYTAGGGADQLARALQPGLEKGLGQSIVMDYRPGAGATIAADLTAKAAADGYTFHLTDSGPMTIVPGMRPVPYDPLKDFTPIGLICSGGTVIVVHPSVPARDIREFIAIVQKEPGKWSYGTSGVGGVGHLAAEQFQITTRTKMTHVPYKGGAPAVVELMGGQVPSLFSSLASAMPQIRAGKIRALAVTSLKRSGALPETPALSEVGFPGFDASIWFGVVAPPNLPADIRDRFSQIFLKTFEDKGVQEAIRAQGYDPTPNRPAEMQEVLRRDLAMWSKVVREANVKAE